MEEHIGTIISQEIHQKYDDSSFSVFELSKAVNMSQATLFRKCKLYFQKSPQELIESTRMLKAKELLTKQNISIQEIAFDIGFTDSHYFSKKFKRYYGVSPQAARA